MSRRPASSARPNSTSRIRARPPWATSAAAGCASSSTAVRPPSAKRPNRAHAAAWSRSSAKAQTAIQRGREQGGDELHRELGRVAQLPGQQHHGDGEDAEGAAGRRAKERALPCQRHDGRDSGQPEGPARGGPDGVHGRDGVVEAPGQRGIGVVEGREPGRHDVEPVGEAGQARRRDPGAQQRVPEASLAAQGHAPTGPRAGEQHEPQARDHQDRDQPEHERHAARRAGRDSSASRCRTGERSRATCSPTAAAASSPADDQRPRRASASGTPALSRAAGTGGSPGRRASLRPRRGGPCRTTSPDELLRCSRMKLSGTWIDGRNVARRGPWKTAVSRGRACPTPAGFASRTTVVSTRRGRASVPTSRTVYFAAG